MSQRYSPVTAECDRGNLLMPVNARMKFVFLKSQLKCGRIGSRCYFKIWNSLKTPDLEFRIFGNQKLESLLLRIDQMYLHLELEVPASNHKELMHSYGYHLRLTVLKILPVGFHLRQDLGVCGFSCTAKDLLRENLCPIPFCLPVCPVVQLERDINVEPVNVLQQNDSSFNYGLKSAFTAGGIIPDDTATCYSANCRAYVPMLSVDNQP
ncbi:hypothetical protein Tco_1499773 [Tanacetum coccineum]